MTREFENMMYLFGCGALGKEVDTERCTELGKIYTVAAKQGIWDVIYSAIEPKIKSGEITVPKNISDKLELMHLSNVGGNIRRIEFNLNIIRKLQENGIDCCMIKGTTIAGLYKVPETRISSDTDILINPKLADKAMRILEKSGYTIVSNLKQSHHIKAMHPVGGLLEVHVSLHSKITSDVILKNKVKYNEKYIKREEGYYTLGINDGLMYLTAHLIKHLIHDGAGPRQMMDMLIYMKKYKDEIDWEQYNSILNELNYSKFINVVKAVGNKYFGFEFTEIFNDEAIMTELLDDAESGGQFGRGESGRGKEYTEYTKKRSGSSERMFEIYSVLNREHSVLKKFFPCREEMEINFAYLKKCPYLLWFAWIQRLVIKLYSLIFKKKCMGNINDQTSENNEILNRRISLMEKLGM